MKSRGNWQLVWGALAMLVAGCTNAPVRPVASLPLPPVHANGQALWRIVDQKCVPGRLRAGDPAPCAAVSLAGGRTRGYAVLKDRAGIAQYLVMPTILISGIEDPRVTGPGAADYFTPAWKARHLVEARAGRALQRDEIGIAVNSQYGRSQDLLHLHVDCMRRDVRDALHDLVPVVGDSWSHRTVSLEGRSFYVRRVGGDETVSANPFELVRTGFHVPQGEMKAWTVLLTGADFAGRPGFLLLAARADPDHGNRGASEILLDHQCGVAGAVDAKGADARAGSN
ncbi:CDP-diacylglycerol diphosphatase [Novosphingobium sp. 9]|uniref:CDP-diacylglycerol diphosphatase n=1 Tax=Novosphingobium sp. 9 TaxID=2025349 RepID=UPI0021B52E49|nr:CDP-diacylglycerol diphosphatase [Novosphingobium sp. 9]